MLINKVFDTELDEIVPKGEMERLRKLAAAVETCKDDTWQCPTCGHTEPWWTESNADYLSRPDTSPNGDNE